ncbi:hypothetical protein [Numidum massiliense]|uniref:hypothetical protein n=1 Tax=Numidum massiliense TaxID=1522315 RepID=UPI0006D52ADB|nr:hypothetical protein [Numidum massiliense]
MKKIFISVTIILSIVIVWYIYSTYQSPIWVGETANGKWKAVYDEEMATKDTWQGHLYWQGEGEVTLTFIQYIINGRVGAGLEEGETMNEHITDKYNFASVSQPRLDSDIAELKFRWRENDEEHEEVIRLKPQKRLFVLPKWMR